MPPCSTLRAAIRLILALPLLATSACISIDLPIGKPGPLVETEIGGDGRDKILLLEIDGFISSSDDAGTFTLGPSENLLSRVRAQLERAAGDDRVKAVVLRINSPGGTATASEILYREIRGFKRETGKPVVAELMGVATSGAYYAAMAADKVLAHPTTVTGSIGVVFTGINLAGLMEKLGIENQTFTSGAFKDTGSPLRPMRPAERAQIQSVLDDLHLRFKQVVDAGRPGLDMAQVEALADGRIYSANQARKAGLVDEITDLPGAIGEARRLAGVEQARIVSFHRSRDWRENLYTHSRGGDPGVAGGLLELSRLLAPMRTPAFLYLWWPGVQ